MTNLHFPPHFNHRDIVPPVLCKLKKETGVDQESRQS